MRRKIVPEVDPEVVRKIADENYGGDTEKVATTTVADAMFMGIHLSSRYNKSHEYNDMAEIIEGLQPGFRERIEAIWCDSKAFVFLITLKPCSLADAKEFSYALSDTFERIGRGHNGVEISGASGGRISLDPAWPGEP